MLQSPANLPHSASAFRDLDLAHSAPERSNFLPRSRTNLASRGCTDPRSHSTLLGTTSSTVPPAKACPMAAAADWHAPRLYGVAPLIVLLRVIRAGTS